MELTRRDLFKGSFGLVGILGGLTSPNGNPYFYGLKAYEYSARSLRFNREQYIIEELIRKGYPKNDAIGIVGDVSRLIKRGLIKII